LPALQKAYQVQKRAARAGFDWERIDDVFEKLHEEIAEVREAVQSENRKEIREELGDLLFSVVNICRYLEHNPEEVLNSNIEKFIKRFMFVEKKVSDSGRDFRDFTIEELDAFWNEAKTQD